MNGSYETINRKAIATPVKIFDVEKKELIKRFETVTEAAEFCGLSFSEIKQAIKYRYRSYKNKLGKTICFR